MRNKFNLALIGLLLFCACPCWSKGMKGNLEENELDYLNNIFFPILIKANICTSVHKDCHGGNYILCSSQETLSCEVHGITDEKVIKEIFLSILNSGLKVSSFTFWRSKYHAGSIFERPILSFTDHTGGK